MRLLNHTEVDTADPKSKDAARRVERLESRTRTFVWFGFGQSVTYALEHDAR